MIKSIVANKAEYFAMLISLISDIDGYIVEIGVGAAKSAKLLCKACVEHGCIHDYWGFDSFKGFPHPSQEDKKSTKNGLRKGYFAEHWCTSPSTARKRIAAHCDFPSNRLNFVEGFYSQTFFQENYDGSNT